MHVGQTLPYLKLLKWEGERWPII